MASLAELDLLMHRAWPALQTIAIDGWIARIAGGITQRANSVLPVAAPRDLQGALEAVERLYEEQSLAPTFQISPAAEPAGLDEMLAGRGYERRAPTVVQRGTVTALLDALPPSTISFTVDQEPDEDWLHLWWTVDGRGGPDAKEIVRSIITACPALYISSRDTAGIAATGRLALVDGWGGIYCMAVRPDARRRGHGRAVLRSLLREAARRHIARVWLQVVEGNLAARALYEQAGFISASRYHYRVRPTLSRQPDRAQALSRTAE